MGFMERELETVLSAAFDWGLCGRHSRIRLQEVMDGEEAVGERRTVLAAIRRFAEEHGDDLLHVGRRDVNLGAGPDRQQAQLIAGIVHGVMDSLPTWRTRVERLLQEVDSTLAIPLDCLLALVAVHVYWKSDLGIESSPVDVRAVAS